MSITVGQRASRSLMFTAEHVRAFAEKSDDYNRTDRLRAQLSRRNGLHQ
jgi:hypothetical protein